MNLQELNQRVNKNKENINLNKLKEELSGVSPVLQPPKRMETAVNPAIIPIIALSLVIITIIPQSIKMPG